AESCARYALVALLVRSIFLPGAGLVLTYVERGSPLSWTIAEPVSTSAPAIGPSVLGLSETGSPDAAPAPRGMIMAVSTAAISRMGRMTIMEILRIRFTSLVSLQLASQGKVVIFPRPHRFGFQPRPSV